MEERGQFTFYRSYYEAVQGFSARVQLAVLSAIIGYGLDGKEPEGLRPIEKALFILVRPTLDAGRKKAQSGYLGGKAKRKQSASKKENEKEKEKENETENEKDSFILSLPEGGFEKFWHLYPVKVDRGTAEKVFDTLGEPEVILQGLEKWLRSKQWSREGGRFIPRPVKFLREKHYLQPPEEIPMGASGQLGQAELEAIAQMMKRE